MRLHQSPRCPVRVAAAPPHLPSCAASSSRVVRRAAGAGRSQATKAVQHPPGVTLLTATSAKSCEGGNLRLNTNLGGNDSSYCPYIRTLNLFQNFQVWGRQARGSYFNILHCERCTFMSKFWEYVNSFIQINNSHILSLVLKQNSMGIV